MNLVLQALTGLGCGRLELKPGKPVRVVSGEGEEAGEMQAAFGVLAGEVAGGGGGVEAVFGLVA